jgi:hypothetical protein
MTSIDKKEVRAHHRQQWCTLCQFYATLVKINFCTMAKIRALVSSVERNLMQQFNITTRAHNLLSNNKSYD